MPSILRCALALCLVFTSLVTFVAAQNTEIPLVCVDGVQIIATVGANVPNGTYGLTVSFVRDVMAAIPGSANFSVNYNRFPGNETAQETFIPEVDEGVPELLAAIYNYTTACPNVPIVLHGYSEGAVVTMNLLCGASSGSFPVTKPLNSSYADHIIAVILYGDETRTANQSYDLGGCTANAPHLPRRSPKGCDAFASSVKSYCFKNDVDCCGTANASAPYPYGINPHYLYPAAFDKDVTKFVVSQYDMFKNITTSTSTTSTTSTKTTSTSTTTKSTTTAPTTKTKTTKTTTKTDTVLSIQTTCSKSIDQCLTQFADHPLTATKVCDEVTSGTVTTTVFSAICTGTNRSSQYSSACACLVLTSSDTTTTDVAASTTAA